MYQVYNTSDLDKVLKKHKISEIDTKYLTNFESITLDNLIHYYNKGKEILDIGGWDVSNIEDLSEFFKNAPELKDNKYDLSSWNTSKIRSLHRTFSRTDLRYFKGLNLWDISNIENLTNTFEDSILDIFPFNGKLFKNLQNMHSCFFNSNVLDISNIKDINISSCKSLANTFAHFNSSLRILWQNNEILDLSSWDTSNVENFNSIFSSCNTDVNVSNWKFKHNISLHTCFYEFKHNIIGIEDWDVSNVRSISHLFYKSNFNKSLNKWNISNIIDMRSAFEKSAFCKELNWDLSHVKYLNYMFSSKYLSRYNPFKLNLPLGIDEQRILTSNSKNTLIIKQSEEYKKFKLLKKLKYN